MITLKEYHDFLEDRLFLITSMTLGQHFRHSFEEKGNRSDKNYDKLVEISREQSDVQALEMIKKLVVDYDINGDRPYGKIICENRLNNG